MKKILSIALAVSMIFAVCALYSSAALTSQRVTGDAVTATEGWEIYNINDFTYSRIYDVEAGKDVTNEEMTAAGDGACIGTNGCVQVYHGPSHLCSTNSVGLTPGAAVIISFNGTGVHLGACFRDMTNYANGGTCIKMIVDGKEVANPYAANEAVPDFEGGKHIVPAIIAGIENLPAGDHVVEFYTTTAVRLAADWYEVPTGTTAFDADAYAAAHNSETADYTAIAAAVACIALAGVAFAAKKH